MMNDAHARIEVYLNRLERRLKRLPADESREIVEELRTHIVERASESGSLTRADVDKALATLGDPNHLADEYLTDALLAQTESSRSPFGILGKLFRWASISVMGLVVFICALVGYFLGTLLAICAVMKPIHPHTTGLWLIPSDAGDQTISLHLGFGNIPPGGREVLGWSLIPIGLFGGAVLVMATTFAARWGARRYRQTRSRRPFTNQPLDRGEALMTVAKSAEMGIVESGSIQPSKKNGWRQASG